MIRANTKPRPGFTLVELLVVMAIIAILIGIIVPAVQRVRAVGTKVSAVSDINQLSLGATAFKTEYGFFPPHSFIVPTVSSNTDVNYALLRRMFPRWQVGVPNGTATGIPRAGETLDGNQCLVYFLGGPTQTGWDNASPTAPSGSTKKGPFFDFPSKRIVNNRFLDPWETPYAYFAQENGQYSGTSTYTPGGPISPFKEGASTKWVNQTGVQVISAGPNQLFGSGGAWAPGASDYTQVGRGGDDLGNFNEGLVLGAKN